MSDSAERGHAPDVKPQEIVRFKLTTDVPPDSGPIKGRMLRYKNGSLQVLDHEYTLYDVLEDIEASEDGIAYCVWMKDANRYEILFVKCP